MKRTLHFRRSIAFLLCLTLMSGCGNGSSPAATDGSNAAVAAADSAVGSTIHLEKTQGTVGVEDEKDVRLDVRDGMQLYSGYEVGTAQVSQAWISLDQTKSLKMDEETTAEVSQSGKDLKVSLQEGKLFFNVTQPLEADESFSIETATMVTGIRGTSGWMEVVDAYTARLTVLEGIVTVESRDPATGNIRTTTVSGGQILTVVYHGDSMGQGSEDQAIQGMIDSNLIIPGNIIQSEDGLRKEQLQEANVPPFVQEEIAQSQQLQETITENSPLSVPEILESMNSASADSAAQDASANAVPEDAVDELPEDAQAEDPQNQPPADQNQDGTVMEVYYEQVTTQRTETFVDTEAVASEASAGSDGSSSGGTVQGSGTVTADPAAPASTYRPIIEFVNGTDYAVVTHAYEDADGNLTIGSSESVQIQGYAGDDVPYIEFYDPDGNPVHLDLQS